MKATGKRTSKGRKSDQRPAVRRKPVKPSQTVASLPSDVPAAPVPSADGGGVESLATTTGLALDTSSGDHSAAAPGSAPEIAAPRHDEPPAPAHAGQSSSPLSSDETDPRTSASRIEEFLGFRLDHEEYCVWIRSIKEIIRPSELTPIPRSPEDILGLISLRGTIVPIFNIRRRLGLPAADIGPKARIVVVVLDAGPVGLVVDHVTEVISIDPDALEPPPPTLGEREASLVTAIVRFQERIVGVLNLDRLVAMDTETPLRAVA